LVDESIHNLNAKKAVNISLTIRLKK